MVQSLQLSPHTCTIHIHVLNNHAQMAQFGRASTSAADQPTYKDCIKEKLLPRCLKFTESMSPISVKAVVGRVN